MHDPYNPASLYSCLRLVDAGVEQVCIGRRPCTHRNCDAEAFTISNDVLLPPGIIGPIQSPERKDYLFGGFYTIKMFGNHAENFTGR